VRNHSATKAELKTTREKLEAFGYVKPEDIGRLSKLEDNPTAARLAEHIANALQARLSAVTHEHSKINRLTEELTQARDKNASLKKAMDQKVIEAAITKAARKSHVKTEEYRQQRTRDFVGFPHRPSRLE
jgi:vacuolar-type H+-ATPase subunit I/STV1